MKHLAEKCLLVDVRTPSEFAEAHIDGSINVPLHDLGEHLRTIVEAAGVREIALVCRSGQRASTAREVLGGQLPNKLHVLEGGVLAWERAGHPLERITGKGGMSLERQVRIVAGGMSLVGALLAWFVHPAFSALPAFVGAGLMHSGITDTCAMGLVLGRMPWNRLSANCAAR